ARPAAPHHPPTPVTPLRPVAVGGGRLRGLAGRSALAAGRLPAGPWPPGGCRRHPRSHRPASTVGLAALALDWAAPCWHERLLHPAADCLLRRQRQAPAPVAEPAAPDLLVAAQPHRAPLIARALGRYHGLAPHRPTHAQP